MKQEVAEYPPPPKKNHIQIFTQYCLFILRQIIHNISHPTFLSFLLHSPNLLTGGGNKKMNIINKKNEDLLLKLLNPNFRSQQKLQNRGIQITALRPQPSYFYASNMFKWSLVQQFPFLITIHWANFVPLTGFKTDPRMSSSRSAHFCEITEMRVLGIIGILITPKSKYLGRSLPVQK